MKILHVIDRLNVGGGEKVFVDMIHLLRSKDVHADAMIFQAGYPLDEKVDKRAKLHVLNRVNKYSLKKMYQAYRVCSQYDIVHVHMRYCYTYIKLTQLLFRGKYKIILHDHFGDLFIDSTVPFGLKRLFKPSYVVAVSNALAEWAIKNLKVNKEDTFLLKNTIMPNPDVCFHNKKEFRKAIMVANIREAKNIEFAVKLSETLGWDVTVFGSNGQDEYYRTIKESIKNNPKIRIVEGVSDLSKIYDQFDFAMHTAKSESGPLVILEYMAYGIPFISYNTGEVAHTAYNELPLHFMNSFNEQEWDERLLEIKKQENISDKLKAVFEKYFGPEKYVNTCIDIYKYVYNKSVSK